MTSYWFATIVSLIAHGLIIALVFVGWTFAEKPEPIKPPSFVKATLIENKTKGKSGAEKKKLKPKKIDLEKKRKEKERLKRLKKQEQLKAQKIKEKKLKEKKEAEKQAKIKEQKEKAQEELKKQAEQERKLLEQQRLEEEFAKERERLEAEQQAEALAQQLEEDEKTTQSYVSLIQKRVAQNWSRPPIARNNMEVLLRLRLIPTGEIIDVVIINSSGNDAFDRSAVHAAEKTKKIPEIKEMPSRVFERDFRRFILTFRPQDLRQ